MSVLTLMPDKSSLLELKTQISFSHLLNLGTLAAWQKTLPLRVAISQVLQEQQVLVVA
jgi:aryl carrier-like protein